MGGTWSTFSPAIHQSYSSRPLGEAASHNHKLSASMNAINTTHARETTGRTEREKTERRQPGRVLMAKLGVTVQVVN